MTFIKELKRNLGLTNSNAIAADIAAAAVGMMSTREAMDRMRNAVFANDMETEVAARPSLPPQRVEPKPVGGVRGAAFWEEYAALAGKVGVTPPDLAVERFKTFLAEKDLPIYALPEVAKYMDAKALAESKEQAGWEWRPLRSKDAGMLRGLEFGRPARNGNGRSIMIASIGNGLEMRREIEQTASDHYRGPSKPFGSRDSIESPGSSEAYDWTIPLHALRRVALIEEGFKEPVAFFVSDYALAPAIEYPDPFLMAVIPNVRVGSGVGRFVIDFWDEPGFGIEQMLK